MRKPVWPLHPFVCDGRRGQVGEGEGGQMRVGEGGRQLALEGGGEEGGMTLPRRWNPRTSPSLSWLQSHSLSCNVTGVFFDIEDQCNENTASIAINFTTLQSMRNAKLSQQNFGNYHTNEFFKTIPTIPHKQYASYQVYLPSRCIKANPGLS